MNKLEYQIAELFSKPEWTVQDWQTIRDLLEQQSPGSMQSFFQENYISELAKSVQPPSDKARHLLERIHSRAGIPETITTPVISIKKRNYWSRIAVAASILIVAGISSYLLFFNQPTEQNLIVTNGKPADVAAPQTNRAMITLADGTTVYLDSVSNGTLASQSGVTVMKTADGQIVYDPVTLSLSKGELVYNTLSNPRGSRVIDMTLSDGSRVWLNAGSSVTYPVAFITGERIVEITGEAYFEVAHNASKPFMVQKGEMQVTVLGTHFNVNAFDDETEMRVTLLEGSVKVSTTKQLNASTILKPGQQALINLSTIQLVNPDLEEVMAWKNGRFHFEGAGIEEVMREIARWYDVEVVYEVKPKEVHFRGGISREVEASKVFKMLETTEAVHFRIEGNKVFVIK